MNYLNPDSFRPQYDWKPTGALAGLWAGNQMDDYNKLMEHQFALQKLGLEDAGINLQEKKAGLPLADLGRRVKTESLEGMLPHARTGASEKALADIEGSRYEQVEKGPEGRSALSAKLDDVLKTYPLEQMKREAQIGKSLIERAVAQGPAGREELQKELDRLRKSGYSFPQGMEDPANWNKYLRGFVDTADAIRAREMEEAKAQERMSLERFQQKSMDDRQARQLSLTRELATERQANVGAGKNPTVQRLIAEVNSLPEGPVKEQKKQVLRQLMDHEFEKQWPRISNSSEGMAVGISIIGKPEAEARSIMARFKQQQKQEFLATQVPELLETRQQQKPTTNYKNKYGLE